MNVIRAECMGFCAGVRRAVMTADEALAKNKDGQVYTFGPLIHNPAALRKFEERGLKVLSEDEIPAVKKEDTVVIRAHGVSPEIAERLTETGAEILNGTCPIVQSNQKKCAEFAGKGWTVFFTGDKDHGEVAGIEGAARRACLKAGLPLKFILAATPKQARDAAEKIKSEDRSFDGKKAVLISQTTFSIKVFDLIAEVLRTSFPEITVVRSICPATFERQSSLDKLCCQVDGVLVIGGKNSANTTRLFNKAKELSRRAAFIENASEIPEDFFLLKTVGLTAGASTPDEVIEEVESRLMRFHL